MWGCLLLLAAVSAAVECAGAGAARLACYVEGARATDLHECTHIVYAGDARGDTLDGILKEYRKYNPRAKIMLRVADVDKVSYLAVYLCGNVISKRKACGALLIKSNKNKIVKFVYCDSIYILSELFVLRNQND